MNQENNDPKSYQASHMLVLISYTIMAVLLIAAIFLMEWETWAVILISISVVLCWMLHITRTFTNDQRIWIYVIVVMVTFFYYGTHEEIAYDMSPLISIAIMVLITTRERKLIWLAMGTYYVTFVYALVVRAQNGIVYDAAIIVRTAFHFIMVTLAGWVAQMIIRQWNELFRKSDDKITDLNEATRRVNLFLANLSHELRTPINAILGINSVNAEKEKDPEIRGNMEEISLAGRRVERQTEDILDYSEIETGNLVTNQSSCSISSVLNDLVISLKHKMPDELEFVIDVEPELPAVLITDAYKLRKIIYHLVSNGLKFTKEGGVYLRLSGIRQDYGMNLFIEVSDTGIGMRDDEIEVVFRQFYQTESSRGVRSGGLGIGMAIVSGFVRALGGFLTVRSRVGEGTTVCVSIPMEVADDRPCMKLEDPEKVVLVGFMKFRKFPNPNVREYYNSMIKHTVSGLGLPMHRVDNPEDLQKLTASLNVTHLIVGEKEYMDNYTLLEKLAKEMVVTVITKPSISLMPGSRVFLLPKPFYGFPILNILNKSLYEEREKEKRMLCPGVRALVVDDEPMNLRVADNILSRYRMDVTTASSGREAIDLCTKSAFDIIFMDHMMPEMDGVETIKQIRFKMGTNDKRIPVVMLTANTLSTAGEIFALIGADGYVAKPIETAELERVLKNVLPETSIVYEELEEDSKEKPVAKPAQVQTKDMLAAYGINAAEGLKYCQNDEEFYREMLLQYVSEAPSKREDLGRYYEEENYPDYAIVVHALKSTSKMIGAASLSEMARTLEEAAKNEDPETVRRLHDGMIRAYTDLVRGICFLLGVEEGVQEPEDEILEFLPDEEEGE